MTASEVDGYRAKAASGAAIIALAQAAKTIIHFASTVVLARLLAPDDFGVMAMVAPVIAFLAMLQNMGFTQTIIQHPDLSQNQLSSLFWANAAFTLVVALLLAAFSPLIGLFYGDPRAAHFALVSCIAVLLSGLTLQHSAMLNRDLKFGQLAAIETISVLVSAIVGVIAAWRLGDYRALLAGPIALALFNLVLFWGATRWRPGRAFDLSTVKDHLRFGRDLSGFNLLNFISRNADNVLIAKAAGPAALGLYDRAYRLMMFPLQNINNPMSRVALPILGRVREEPERFRQAYLRFSRSLLVVTFPGVAAATLTSGEFVTLLLGERWAPAAPIFFWLGLAGAHQVLTNTVGWIFIALARGRTMMRWGLYAATTTLLAFIVGLPWGALGVAMAYAISDYVLRVPVLYAWVGRVSPVKARDLYLSLAPFFAAAPLTWAGVAGLRALDVSPIGVVFGAGVLSYALSAAALSLTAAGRENLLDIWSVARRAFARR